MNSRVRLSVFGALATLLIATGSAMAQPGGPLISDEERHLAINDPDRFAWLLFVRINQAVPGDARGRVLWETWALANDD